MSQNVKVSDVCVCVCGVGVGVGICKCVCVLAEGGNKHMSSESYWGPNKIAALSQTTYQNAPFQRKLVLFD